MDLREKILQTDDIPSELVFVDEWDCEIKLIGMSGKRRSTFIVNAIDQETGKVDMEELYPELLIYAMRYPEDNKQIFTDEDRAGLMEKSGKVLEMLAQKATALSGIGAVDVEEAEKN